MTILVIIFAIIIIILEVLIFIFTSRNLTSQEEFEVKKLLINEKMNKIFNK